MLTSAGTIMEEGELPFSEAGHPLELTKVAVCFRTPLIQSPTHLLILLLIAFLRALAHRHTIHVHFTIRPWSTAHMLSAHV